MIRCSPACLSSRPNSSGYPLGINVPASSDAGSNSPGRDDQEWTGRPAASQASRWEGFFTLLWQRLDVSVAEVASSQVTKPSHGGCTVVELRTLSGTADNVAWLREVISEAEGFSAARTYMNFSGQEETAAAEFVQAACGVNFPRLAEVKTGTTPTTCSSLITTSPQHDNPDPR